MNKHLNLHKIRHYSHYFLIGIFFFLLPWGCHHKPVQLIDEGLKLSISYEVPKDLPSPYSSEKDLAVFAWNEFFALNWAASWPKDNKRTTPDTDWQFSTGGKAPNLAVWETYLHRSELRPDTSPLKDRSTGKPYYSYVKNIDTQTNGISLNDFWNNLDEDNEISSCYLLAYDSLEVLYMAKTNLDEYNYLKNNLPTNAALKTATQNGKGLKYLKHRTKHKEYCNSDTAVHVVCLPCGDEEQEGAIEIKTAWRFLTSKDDPSRFMLKKVVYYTEKGGQLIANEATMALIGIHIIHKTKNYPSFIFASFEQVDVRDHYTPSSTGEQTTIMNYYGNKVNNKDPHTSTPVIPRAISPTISTVNGMAKSIILTQNPASLWQYYRLIGVQGNPYGKADPNYYMANYVVESDSMLTFFDGNLVYNGELVNMGGCQGCHGQGQHGKFGGTDFSFILEGGAGHPIGGPDVFQSVQEVRISSGDLEAVKDFIKK